MKFGCLFVCALILAAANARSVREVKEDAAAGTDAASSETPTSSEQKEEPKVECSPVKCGPLCREAIGQSGCPTCLCDPACSPPKCEQGCRVHFDPALRPCPGCVCDGKEVENQNSSSYSVPELIPLPKCSCDLRYLKHYETKKCKPVYEEDCECPVRFDCPEELEPQRCEYKEKLYEIGDTIPTASSCEICSCSDTFRGGSEITCIPIECPSLFGPALREGCYEVFEEDKCCSVDTKCLDDEGKVIVAEPTCEYNGRTYHKGERIYPEEDPCKSCICDENWTGINSNSCRIHDCLLERHLTDLRRGCIPIYHEKTCCPIEFHCGSGNEDNLNDTLTPKTEGACYFDGKSYSLGEQLDIKHPTNCVSCTCRTPPDFTCVHISCPRPPNDDYDNCRPIYHEHSCCPTYDCHLPTPPLICDPVKCVNGCKEVWAPDGCSICSCGDQVLCYPPRCPPTCDIEYEVPEGSCPRCKCPITVQLAPVHCDPVKCDPECFEAVGSNGCATCICGHLCTPPKCDENCSIQYDVPRGQCPRCVCPTALDGEESQQIQCSPVKCGPACREVEGQSGCPTCLCGPLCSPPRCAPGCEVETVPSSGPCPGCVCKDQHLFNVQCSPPKCDPGCEAELVPSSGPCPGCVCKEGAQAAGVQCAPVKCGTMCREAVGDFGCPTCVCDPLCGVPMCAPGCEIETAPFSGPCPGCVCDSVQPKISGIQCAPVNCGPACREVVGQSGCPTCLCGPICDPPKCDPGCEIEEVPSSGPCPGCICGEKKDSEIQCAPVKCGPACREIVGQSGCPTCLCGPICDPPKCDPGCEIEEVPSSGPCPGCICGEKKDRSEVQCAPVKCGPQCREAEGQFGCPMCLCDPLCSPPKCDPGCEIETAPFAGPCPSCVCKDQPEQKVQCAPVKCGPGCREAPGDFGCPTCVCEPVCGIPKCDEGCRAEIDASRGPCPTCVCDEKKGST